ncbi:hypothetical protein F7725_018432, partial [Dissostichus mawsoni]
MWAAAAEAAEAVESEPEPLSVFRTRENDPACHSEQHMGQYYTLPSTHIRTLFPHGLPGRYQQQLKTFNEACMMVRKPSLEVISYLKKTDFSKPSLRYLFSHIWMKNCKELMPSSYNDTRFDQPLQASEWLRNFRITNEPFLSKIKTKQRYVWTKRESTEEGSLLGQLVDQGISRVKSSSDVELRLQSGQPESDFRMAVAVDGVNGLWGRSTIKKKDKNPVESDELTLVYNLKKLLTKDWTGGAIITTLSQTGSLYTSKFDYLPQELLGERGFDSMDPFLPVSVPNYSEKEFESCYLYWMDRQWLQHPQSRTEEGKKEIIFLCNRNPSMMDRI